MSRCLPSTPARSGEESSVGLQASTLCPALASQQRVPYALNQIVRFRDLKPGCVRYAEVRVKPTLVSTVVHASSYRCVELVRICLAALTVGQSDKSGSTRHT